MEQLLFFVGNIFALMLGAYSRASWPPVTYMHINSELTEERGEEERGEEERRRGGNAREMGRTRDNNVRGTFYWRGRNRYFRPTSQFLLEHRGGAAACLPRSPSTDDRGKGRLFSFNLFLAPVGAGNTIASRRKGTRERASPASILRVKIEPRASVPVERKRW